MGIESPQNNPENEQEAIIPDSFDLSQVETPIEHIERVGKYTPEQEEEFKRSLDPYRPDKKAA